MNTEQMLELARMRLQGISLDEIASTMGCSRQQVVKGMNKLIRYLRGRNATKTDIIYPNIRRVMQEKCMSMQELADAAGIYKETLHYILTGRTRNPRMYTAQQGPRVTLASSEMLLDPWSMEFEIARIPNAGTAKSKALSWDEIELALSYGEYHGFCQWRNAGYGSFRWERIK